MKKIIFSIPALAMLLGSCSTNPKVTAELMESHPARPAESVMIYEEGEVIPSEARAIGKVKVTDGGMTPTYDCLYGNMLSLAVKKTAESGGNALQINKHKRPASHLGSTCHRIWGTMFLMPDSLVKQDVLTAVQRIEMNEDIELAQMARDQIAKAKRQYNNPPDIIKVNAGPAWITSKVETDKHIYNSKVGYAFNVDYQHLWRTGLGFGINYIYYGTSFDEGFDVRMHYIGPSFVCSWKPGDKWRWDTSLGVGYGRNTEKADEHQGGVSYSVSASESNVAGICQMGIEYMVSKKIAIGFQINAFTMSFDRPEGYDTDKYDFYGVRRMDTLLGIRFYL